MNKKRTAFIAAAGIALGFALGFVAKPPQPFPAGKGFYDTSVDYKYINPLIGFSLGPKELFPEYKPLDDKLSSYIQSAKDAKKASSVSVYFRDLNSGRWTGVNEDDHYAPASMMKVVVMLSYLDRAEDDKSILSQLLPYTHTSGFTEDFSPSSDSLPSGQYTVQQLISRMIIDSDNDALDALSAADQGRVARVNEALRLPSPNAGSADPASDDFMSARAYSAIFRTLYNATYLSRNVSEQALKLLTETAFKDGLVAGLPPDIEVAHKFGERAIFGPDKKLASRELHDCGIVYLPGKPYLLCVMTKGQDYATLASVIADISGTVYNEVK